MLNPMLAIGNTKIKINFHDKLWIDQQNYKDGLDDDQDYL